MDFILSRDMNFSLRSDTIVLRLLLGVCALALLPACSGRPKNVAKKVTGTVTLDGKPLADARITFAPTNGSPSSGHTDAEGKYNLIWSAQGGRTIEGAQIGEHGVTISTLQFGDPSTKPPKPEVPEKVPYKYRTESGQLKATVKAGANEIDFKLEPGPVEPPQAKGKTKGKK